MIAVRVPRAIKIIAIVYLAYLALMTLLVMPALNILAPKIYHQQTGRELRLDKIILLNPFTLALSVRNASSANADGSSLWSFEQLRVDVSLASLWRRHLVLDELRLHGLKLDIEQKSAERYNFSDILDYRAQHYPAQPVAQPAAAGDALFPISIGRVALSAAHLGLKTPYTNEPLALAVDDVAVALTDLTTAAQEPKSTAPALHSGAVDIALKTIAINFLRAQEPFATRLQNLKITMAELATDAAQEQPLQIAITDASGGQLNLQAALALGAKRASGNLTLRNLDLLPAWQYMSPKLSTIAQRGALDGDVQFAVSWSDALRYSLHDTRFNLHDVQLQSKLDTDTSIALASLQLEGLAIDSQSQRAQIARMSVVEPVLHGWNRETKVSLLEMLVIAAEEEKESANPWQVQIAAIDTQGGAIHWRASHLDNLPLTIAPLTAHITNLHWPEAAPLQLQFDTTINTDTHFSLRGELIPVSATGQLNVEINGLPVIWANPILSQYMQATLRSGSLSTRTQLTLDKRALTAVQSEGVIAQFEFQRVSDKQKLLAWKQLRWQQLTLDLRKRQLQLRQVVVDQPWTQFRINQGGTNNFQQLMAAQTPQPQQKPAPSSPAEKPWRFAVDKVHVEKATLDFRDQTLPRAFRANITDLTGDITGLSNSGRDNAKVALKGSIDGYAPVALSGTVNPFAATPAMNIALDITNLDLATLTPYSGTYAGYQIDSGRLTLQLVYTLQDNRIKGTNHIIVNQMQLGKQVSGPKVMDLPLRFAIYLLTDENGVMDLGVDVSGSVDDPDFSVGSIIWKAFRNLIVKTVTSPFRALSNLVGGAHQDDLDRVEFTPGSDRIEAAHSDKLRTLITALDKKPALKLGVTGHVSPSHDIEALRDNALSEQLIAEGDIKPTDIQQQSKAWQREVAKLFRERFPERKAEALAPMQMNDAMRDNIELPSNALLDLATRRGLAVKQSLVVDMNLAADRAFVKPVDLGADKNPGLHATLEVE